MSNSKQKEDFVAYLLGRLPEPDRERLEERFFADTALFDDLTAAEDELVDAYILGRMTPNDKRRFDEYYLASPDRAEKVAAARQLRTWMAAQRPAPAPWWERLAESLRMPVWALGAAAAALFVTAASWMVLSSRPAAQQQQPPQIAQQQPPQQQQQPPISARETPDVVQQQPQRPNGKKATPPAAAVFAFTLLPGALRGAASSADVQTVTVPSAATSMAQMTLRLEQPPDLASYRVAIETVEGGRVVWQGVAQIVRGAAAATNNDSLHAAVPLAGLAAGDYLVRVSGAPTIGGNMESVADYPLRIKR